MASNFIFVTELMASISTPWKKSALVSDVESRALRRVVRPLGPLWTAPICRDQTGVASGRARHGWEGIVHEAKCEGAERMMPPRLSAQTVKDVSIGSLGKHGSHGCDTPFPTIFEVDNHLEKGPCPLPSVGTGDVVHCRWHGPQSRARCSQVHRFRSWSLLQLSPRKQPSFREHRALWTNRYLLYPLLQSVVLVRQPERFAPFTTERIKLQVSAGLISDT